MTSIFLIWSPRLGRAIATKPDLFPSQNTIVLVCLYALFTLILGWRSHFFQWEPQSSKTIVKIMATSAIAPALAEELFFRVLLLPAPSDDLSLKSRLIWSISSLFLFIVYHPLNALTFFPQAKTVFLEPIFLILAASLGIVCTIAYWQTGSLWLPVIIHWLTVVLWLSCLGGSTKLNYTTDK